MAKDPTSQRPRGLHLLNDRLLALKNLVRARNREITMEYSKELDEAEADEDSADSDMPDTRQDLPQKPDSGTIQVTGDRQSAAPDIDPGVQIEDGVDFEPNELPILQTGTQREDSVEEEVPLVAGEEPTLIDLDDLPILTEKVSTEASPIPGNEDHQPVVSDKEANQQIMGRDDHERVSSQILALIDEKISYANLPNSTSTDHEALKRAIADHLEKEYNDS